MSHSAAQPGRPTHDDDEARDEARPGKAGGRQHPFPALVLIALGIGVFAGLAGLAPWIGTGMVLPLQNLWAFQTMPEDMPVALLPLSQYMAIRIVGLMVTGGLVAAMALRLWAPARHWAAVGWAAAGLLLVQIAAAVQSFSVLGDGLLMGRLGDLYFYGLLAGVVAAMAAAVLVLLAVRSRSKAVAALGIGLAAVPTGEWLFAWGEVFWESFALPPVVSMLGHWFPAVLVGLALAWCPPDRMGRAAVWVVDLALLWTVPVLFDAVAGALGTRVFRGDLALMQEYAAGSFTAALDSPGAVGTVVLAAALGVAGVLVRMVSRRTA